MRGQLMKYNKTIKTSRNPLLRLDSNYALRRESNFRKKCFSRALTLIKRMMSSIY